MGLKQKMIFIKVLLRPILLCFENIKNESKSKLTWVFFYYNFEQNNISPFMTITERHNLILKKVKELGQVSVLALSEELDVSEVTIRKDLKLLEEKNLLYRVHGGAALENPYASDRTVNEKESINTGEKIKIAREATRLIRPNDSIILASGTSILALARNLPVHTQVTVITSALNVAIELTRHPRVEILQLGGTVRHSSSSVIGSYAEMILKDVTCNLVFLGVDGIDPEIGLTTTSLGEARLNQEMIKVAQKVVVLADSTKFGRRGMAKICPLSEVDIIVTDSGIGRKTVSELEEEGIQVLVV